jgi:ankyrin repeat protein
MMKRIRRYLGVLIVILALGFLADSSRLQAVAEDNFFQAVMSGEVNYIKKMLDEGANVNQKDDQFGITPLHTAAYHGRMEVVNLLLRSKAEVNAKDKEGETPLLSALSGGHAEVGELLIRRGALIDVKTKNGWTPLHFAAALGKEELVRLLVEKGAELNAKTSEGKTPLDLAVAYRHKEIAAIIEKKP